MEIIQKFAADYKLTGKETVHFGNTTVDNVLNNFGAIHAPSIYVYNEQGNLVASFSGQTAIDTIVKVLWLLFKSNGNCQWFLIDSGESDKVFVSTVSKFSFLF